MRAVDRKPHGPPAVQYTRRNRASRFGRQYPPGFTLYAIYKFPGDEIPGRALNVIRRPYLLNLIRPRSEFVTATSEAIDAVQVSGANPCFLQQIRAVAGGVSAAVSLAAEATDIVQVKFSRSILGIPLHPLIVPFPLVLWLTSPIFAAIALWLGPQPWWGLSLGVTAIGVAIGIPAIATGLLEFVHRAEVDIDVRLSVRHGIRTSLAWLLLTGKLIMAAILPATKTTIGIALAVDLLACVLLVQGVIYGVRLIYSEDIRQRNL